MSQPVQTGIDLLFSDSSLSLKNQRLGLLAHPASINSQLVHSLDILHQHPDLNLVQLYGPEHGLRGEAQDMEGVESEIDQQTQLPVKSLYGNTIDSLKPTAQDLENIDTLICDLQDIGARYYTYIYTMAFMMEKCGELGKKVIVLDRPNPINGTNVEGPVLQKGYESFVGAYPLPIRHGMTIGELAIFFNEEFNFNCDLHIVRMQGWQRDMYFDNTQLPWVMPSPNMPTLETALVYPGMCLIEATEISEARGTTRPFELVGAPYIKADQLADQLNNLQLTGIRFRPTSFKPGFQKQCGQNCFGVQLHVTDRNILKPYSTGLVILKTIYQSYPNDFQWRHKPYEFVEDIPAIDLLTGDDSYRLALETGKDIDCKSENGLDEFREKRQKYLLY